MAFRDLFDSDRRSKEDLRKEIELRDGQISALKIAEYSSNESAKQLRIDIERLEKALRQAEVTNRQLEEEIHRTDEKAEKLSALCTQQDRELSDLRATSTSTRLELSHKVQLLEAENLQLRSNLANQQNFDAALANEEIMTLKSKLEELSRQKHDEMESSAAYDKELPQRLERALEEINQLKSTASKRDLVTEQALTTKDLETVELNIRSRQTSNLEPLAKQEMLIALQRHGISNVKQLHDLLDDQLDDRIGRYHGVDVRFKNDSKRKLRKRVEVFYRTSGDAPAFSKTERKKEATDGDAEVARLRSEFEKLNESANKRIKDLEDKNKQLEERNGTLFITNIAIDNENKALKAKAFKPTDQPQPFNEPNSNGLVKLAAWKSKESNRDDTYDRQIETLANVNRDLQKELEKLRVKSVDREVFDNAQQQFQLQLDRERENYKALLERRNGLQRQVQYIQVQFSQQTSSLQREMKGFQNENDVLRKSLVATQTSLTHPIVLRWLLEKSTPDTASVPRGAYAISGELPWGSATLIRELAHRGFVKRDLFDKSVDFIVLGKQGWSEKDLHHKISSSDRTFLRFYSQEMFVAKLITTRDPFDTEDRELFEAFAVDHPALQFLMSYNQSWPFPTQDDDEGSWDGDWNGFGISESPLRLAGYRVGVTSKLSVYARHQILRDCYEKELQFAQDATKEYQKQWGKAGTPKRLLRIAQHLKQLADSQGRDHRKTEAQIDWINDLEWLRREIYIKSGSKFKWP